MYSIYQPKRIHPEFEAILNFNGAPDFRYELENETPPAPKGLTLLEHFAVLKKMNASGLLISDSTPSKITPELMNPGFIDISSNQLIVAPALQQGLADLVKSKYKKYIRSDKPTGNDNFSIALVDLTDKKINKPELAGWGSTVARNAASTAKIVFLYAIHQLKFDLEVLLSNASVTTMAEAVKFIGDFQRKFRLDASNLSWSKIFDYDIKKGNVKLSFSSDLSKIIFDVFNNNNYQASKLLHHVSYPYLASLLWQSGLRHPSMGGLWITSDYGNAPYGVNKPWTSGPPMNLVVSTHNITALSGVTFFTLMAQGRLVNELASRQIKETLRNACTFFWSGNTASRTSISKRPAAKCGVWSLFYNDVILIEYEDKKYRYAACALTNLHYDKDFYLDELLLNLDDLIRANNP